MVGREDPSDPGSDSGPELSPMDTLMLKGDGNPRTRAIITVVLHFDGTPAWAEVRAAFARATRTVPRMRQRVLGPLIPGLPAEWSPDPEFDLDFHLRRIGVPAGGGMPAVLDLAARLSTSPMDAARPLWDATFVDLSAGDAALVFRTHHAMTDGLGALAMLAVVVRPQEQTATGWSAPSEEAVVSSRRRRLQRTMTTQVRTSTRRSIRVMRVSTKFGVNPRAALRATVDVGGSVRRLATRPAATPSPLLRTRSRRRIFRTLEVPLDDLRAAGKAHGCTVNDAYLSALLGGFNRYSTAHGGPIVDVPMALPISTRAGDNTAPGNYVSMARLSGPAAIEDAAERMRAVHDAVTALRADAGGTAMGAITDLLQYVPAALAVRGLTAHAEQVDLHASNLVGAPSDIHLAGARVASMFTFGPLSGVPVMTVLLSYRGVCEIGLTLDPAAVRDPDLFVGCLRDSFAEIAGIGGFPSGADVS